MVRLVLNQTENCWQVARQRRWAAACGALTWPFFLDTLSFVPLTRRLLSYTVPVPASLCLWAASALLFTTL